MSAASPHLPIDDLLPDIIVALRSSHALVLQAEPGAGKTTRVPPALLNLVDGEVIVLEPRRLPTRMAARRVALEMGEEVGGTVGYRVRFDEKTSAKTRLCFVTEGIFLRRILADATLRGVGAVVLDEFHERHLDADLALALLRHTQRTARPDLKIVVMSATLDAEPVAAFLGDCPTMHVRGREYPLSIGYGFNATQLLQVQVRLAVEQLLREGHSGHTLVFLPGAAEIRSAMRECERMAHIHDLLMLPLHGNLSPAEQDRAVGHSVQRKLVLSTNVAESSVTVDGVTAVIDSGLARVATHSRWTGLPSLEVRRISKASATQRAGRAGRTAPGRVVRLFSEAEFQQRAEHDLPEILRSDLTDLVVTLRAMQPPLAVADMQWLTPPEEHAVQQAETLMHQLAPTGAMARKLARYPLPARLARMMVAAERRGVAAEAAIAAALLSTGRTRDTNDLLTAMDAHATAPDPAVRQAEQQLRSIAGVARMSKHAADDEPLLMAVLEGFPDRVARRRSGKEMLLSNGASAEVSGEPLPYEFAVVLDAQDRSDRPLPLVRMASRMEPEWLIDLFPDRVHEEESLVWNRAAERVESVTALRYDNLLLQEWRNARPTSVEAAQRLAEEAVAVGVDRFVDRAAAENLLARAAFAELPVPDLHAELEDLCMGLERFSMDALRKAAEHLLPSLQAKLEAQRLRDLAPDSVLLNAGRKVAVNYQHGQPPWVASRMQDFFGMQDGPRVGPDRTPVVMHLLGPNQRAVQTTADLRGFWHRLYPEVRRELMRRYPRHKWPENPLSAEAVEQAKQQPGRRS